MIKEFGSDERRKTKIRVVSWELGGRKKRIRRRDRGRGSNKTKRGQERG